MSDDEAEYLDSLTDQLDDEEDRQEDDTSRKNLLSELDCEAAARKASVSNGVPPDKEHMKIFLRVRPFSTPEIITGENQGCMEILSRHALLAHAPKTSHTYKNSVHGSTKHTHKFSFSRIFDERTTQKDFFDECMLNTVKDFIDGQNCLIFTYGVTNSGKTYTVQGTSTETGMLPRSLDVLFNSIQGRQWDNMALKPSMFCAVTKLSPEQEQLQHQIKESVLKLASDDVDVTQACDVNETVNTSKMTINSTISEDSLMLQTSSESIMTNVTDFQDNGELPSMLAAADRRFREETAIDVHSQGNIKFSVWVSFAEVYNEYIYDLLDPVSKKKSARHSTLQLREDKNGMPYIKGLKQIHTSSSDEAYKLLMIGKKNLQMACTKLNRNSSRSHCIFTIKMVRVYDKKDPRMARISMLSFCDLAGAERSSKTEATGERMKEAGNINTSLLALSRCMTNLRFNQTNKEHPRIVPFRESKLTRLFQSYFSGKGRASMIVNVNQCASMFDETLHALKYSAIAKQVIITNEPEKVSFKRPAPLAVVPPTPKRCRHTIEWATPGTMAKAMMAEVSGPANEPLPEEDELDEEEEEEERTSSTKVKSLLDIIEELKQQLMDAKCSQMSQELLIRQEVCQEMAQQLVEIEQSLVESHKMDKALLEEKADKRLELLAKSYNNRVHKTHNDDDDNEYVDSVLLHAEQVKVENLERTVEDLREQLLTTVTAVSDERGGGGKHETVLKDLVDENTRLKSDLAVLRDQLQENLDVTEGMAELQQVVQESQLELESAGKKLVERDEQLHTLQSRVGESETETATVQNALLATEDQVKQLRDQITAQQQDCRELPQEITSLKAQLEKSSCQQTKMSQLVDMLQCDSDDHRQQLESVTRESAQKDEKISQLKWTVTELEALVAALQSRLNGTENVVVEQQLNRRLADLTLELKDKEEQVRKAEDRVKRMDTQLAAEKERAAVVRQGLREELELSETEVVRLTAEMLKVEGLKDGEIAALTDSMRQANAAVRGKTLEATALSRQLGERRERSEEMQRALSSLQHEVDDYVLRVNEQAEEIGVLKECRDKKERGATNADQVVVKQECVDEPQVDAPTADELSAAKKRVSSLETQLEQSEYKHQMSCRQLRREKTQLEKLLRETETALTEAQEVIDEAEFKSHESIIDAEQSNSKQVVDAERKVSQVTAAMRDLETCLRSSKATEEVLCGEVETLRDRCRHLQEAVYRTEDGERPDDGGLVEELEACRKELGDGEKSQALLESRVEEMKTELGAVEIRSEKCRREADTQRACLVAQVEEARAELTVAETATKRERKALDRAQTDLSELQGEVASLNERHASLEASLSQKISEISELQTEIATLRATISEDGAKFDAVGSDKTALLESVSEKDHLIAQLRRDLSTVEEDAGKTNDAAEKQVLASQGDLEEARNLTREAEVSCREKEEELVRLRNVDDTVSSLKAHIVDKTDECACLAEKLTQMTATATELREEIGKTKDEKANSETKAGEELANSEMKAQEDLKNSEEEHSSRMASLKEQHSQELSSLREELANKGDVGELQARVEAMQTKTTELESELARSQASAEQSGKHLATSKREMELLDEQLKRTETRESRLRSQLQQSSTRVEEQNQRFTTLDTQVLTLRQLCDRHEAEAKEATSQHIDAKEEIERLTGTLSERSAQTDEAEGRLARERSSLQLQLDSALEQLDKKEVKLRTRSKCVTELMEKLETERNSFQVALKDAELNEKMIEQLKAVLHEQEATMETQDTVIRNREDEITSLTTDLSEQQVKVRSLLTDENKLQSRIAGSDKVIVDLKSTVTDLERQCKTVTAHDSSTERDVAELRRQLQDVTELRRELRGVELERSQLEKALKDIRGDTDKQQKDQELEKRKLLNDVAKLQEHVRTAETKTGLELAKWREERDKLVGGLESILKQKDVRISKLEAQATVTKSGSRQDTDMATMIRAKDAIISDLKEQNVQLQQRFTTTDLPVAVVALTPLAEADVAPVKRVTRRRTKKRLSGIAVEEATAVPARKRRTTRQSHKPDENVNPHDAIVKSECHTDLGGLITTPKPHHASSRTVLNNSTNLGEDRMPEFMSPVATSSTPRAEDVLTSTCKKRMRRLRSTAPQPFCEAPTVTTIPETTESPHNIVTRRLRSRRK